MAIRLITPPGVEPITTADAKLHLRVSHSADDAYIDRLIKSARQYVERYTQRALIEQTWEKVIDAFPATGTIDLPMPPTTAVVSVKYIDTNGVEQTLNPASYQSDLVSQPAWIMPAYGYDWPDTRDQPNAVKIQYKSGFGATAADVPEDIKTAMYLLIGHWYENREAVSTQTTTAHSFAVEALLAPYRMLTIA